MVHKIMRVLPMLLIASVMLSACSKAEDISDTTNTSGASYEEDTDGDFEIQSMEGYYLRTNHSDMILAEYTVQGRETYYEPTIIYFEGDENGEVPMDSLKTGDKIEVDVKIIMESYPAFVPIYGLRFIEEGDISNIDDTVLLHLEDCGHHAVIGEKTEQPPVARYSGYFVRTETDCFLVPSDEYAMLRDVDLLKIYPADEMGAPPDFDVSGVSLDGFKTGDMIWVDIMLVQELYPPISPICGAVLIEEGDISNIEQDVVSKLSELGYTVVETE